jgi:serine/threonine-protein kinase
VGSYRVTAKIGEGGMGAVYCAEHVTLGRKAAVKVLLDEFSHSKEIVARFFNEARAASAIEHPGIISVFDFGYAEGGEAYIVMDLLVGESLAARVWRLGRLPAKQALTIGRQVASALAAAHRRGIVHRDLKPDNISLVPDPDVPGGERAKVLDFGIAKLMEPGAASSVKTATGHIVGTPVYMSPEQCRGRGQIDHRTDVYALGCVLYALIAGRPPFQGEGPGELIAAHLVQPVPPLRGLEPSCPPEVEALVMRLLEKKAEDRPASMEEVARALEALLEGRPITDVPAGTLPVRVSAASATPTVAETPEGRKQDTTLGGAAGQPSVAERPRSRVGRNAALAALVLAAGGVVLWLQRGGPEAPPESPSQAPVPPTGASAAVPEPSPPPPEPPASPAPPAGVTLRLTSEPSGADVFRAADGIRLGQTPFERTIPRTEGEAVLLVRSRGYADETVAMRADRDDQRHLTLKKATRGTGATKPPAPPAKKPQPSGPIKDGALEVDL